MTREVKRLNPPDPPGWWRDNEQYLQAAHELKDIYRQVVKEAGGDPGLSYQSIDELVKKQYQSIDELVKHYDKGIWDDNKPMFYRHTQEYPEYNYVIGPEPEPEPVGVTLEELFAEDDEVEDE